MRSNSGLSLGPLSSSFLRSILLYLENAVNLNVTIFIKKVYKKKFFRQIITLIGWLIQSQGPSEHWRTSGDLTSAMVGKCPDWKGLSNKDIGPAPEDEELVCLPDVEDVVTILEPESLPLLLNPKAAEVWWWFKFNGFLNGLDGAWLMPEKMKYKNR